MNELKLFFADPLTVIVEQAPSKAPGKAVMTFTMNNLWVKGENMSTTMPQNWLASVSVEWTTPDGKPGKVDGETAWESSDATIVKAAAATGNSLICNLESFDPVGDVSIHATADADLGTGVKTVTSTLSLTVIPGEVTGGTIGNFTLIGPSSGGAPPPPAAPPTPAPHS